MRPDLIPFKSLWRELKSAITKRAPANLKQLKHKAMKCRLNLAADTGIKNSMPQKQCLDDVIEIVPGYVVNNIQNI